MTLCRFAGTEQGLVLAPGAPARGIALPSEGPVLTPVPLNAKMAATGHSIVDAVIKWPWSGVITSAGQTPDIVSGTGPYATAQIRWNDDPAAPNAVRATLNAAGSTDFKLFLGIEAHGGDYGGRASVQTHITWSDARGYALLWHNLAASKGAQTFYANFCRDDPSQTFGSAWRAAHTVAVDPSEDNMTELELWDSIPDYVNANRNPGTPAMRLVPWLQVFLAVYDAIQSGTVTGITAADLFSDNVHPDTVGQWIQMATMMAVMYQRHPDQLSNSVPLEFGGALTIDSGLAAQLRPVVWSTCLALPRTGLQ